MKNQEEKIGVCPFCNYKTIITEENSEIIGTNTVLVWCENEKCQREFIFGTEMKVGHEYVKNVKEDWK